MLYRLVIAVVAAAALLAGCQDKDSSDQVHGTSTRRASVEPARPTLPKPPAASFGEPIQLGDEQTVTVKQLTAAPDAYDGKNVRLAGTITNVCPRKGCWFEMTDASGASDALFVKFTDPDTGRLIPMEAVGKHVVVEGTVTFREISEEHAKHYREEAGATPEELAKIVGPQKQLMLTNPGARIAGVTN